MTKPLFLWTIICFLLFLVLYKFLLQSYNINFEKKTNNFNISGGNPKENFQGSTPVNNPKVNQTQTNLTGSNNAGSNNPGNDYNPGNDNNPAYKDGNTKIGNGTETQYGDGTIDLSGIGTKDRPYKTKTLDELDRKYEDRFNLLSENYKREISTRELEYQNSTNRFLTTLSIILGSLGLIVAVGGFLGVKTIYQKIQEGTSKENIEKLIREKSDAVIIELVEEFKVDVNEKFKEIENYTTSLYDVVRINTDKVENKSKEFEKITDQNKNKIENFTKSLEKVKTEDQYSYLDWYYKAINEKEKKNYKTALDFLNNASNLNPNDPELFFQKGYIYDELKQYDDAVSNYTNAIFLNPYYSDAYFNRAISYENLNRNELALNDYKKVIELTPTDPDPYENMGKLFLKSKDNFEAQKYYEEAYSLNKKCFNSLIEIYIIRGEYSKITPILNEIKNVKIKPANKLTLYYLLSIFNCIMNRDNSDNQNTVEELLKKNVKHNWDTNDIASWIETAKLSEDKKEYIKDLTNQFKKIEKTRV